MPEYYYRESPLGEGIPEPDELLTRNREWADYIKSRDPNFFEELAAQQTPKYLWIGCSDSRVPANQIVGLAPGEMFVHRNVANLVVKDDINCLSVVQYAVDVLKVEHIIVTGHYGCGGIRAALEGTSFGLVDGWLRHVTDVLDANRATIDAIPDFNGKWDKLGELNVKAQVESLASTDIIQQVWARGQSLSIHGWIYGIQDGIIRELRVSRVK